jgi:hypothetical protein
MKKDAEAARKSAQATDKAEADRKKAAEAK